MCLFEYCCSFDYEEMKQINACSCFLAIFFREFGLLLAGLRAVKVYWVKIDVFCLNRFYFSCKKGLGKAKMLHEPDPKIDVLVIC